MNRFGPGICLMIAVLVAACGSGSPSSTGGTAATTTPASASPSPKTEFEESLQYVRNGQYTYIYVISRKDGKPLDGKDGDFLRTKAPQVVDWVKADGLKKFIGGTNFNLEEGNLAEIRKRFVVEDYSSR